jgi:hypothetical protein
MKKDRARALPVDPARLRQQFPQLTDEDVVAFETVTRSVLDLSTEARGRRMHEVLEQARHGRERQAAGQALDPAETLAVRYLSAVEKMQGTSARDTH